MAVKELVDIKKKELETKDFKAVAYNFLKAMEAFSDRREYRGSLYMYAQYLWADVLKEIGDYEEAIKSTETGIELCRRFESFGYAPWFYYISGVCKKSLGSDKAEYMEHFNRAYHVAYAIGKKTTGKELKQKMKQDNDIEVGLFGGSYEN